MCFFFFLRGGLFPTFRLHTREKQSAKGVRNGKVNHKRMIIPAMHIPTINQCELMIEDKIPRISRFPSPKDDRLSHFLPSKELTDVLDKVMLENCTNGMKTNSPFS